MIKDFSLLFLFFLNLSPQIKCQCRDIHPSCELFSSLDLCANISQQPIMKFNCAKTCGFCGKSIGDCIDRSETCEDYKEYGLCETDDKLRVEYVCAKTCNVCNNPV